MVYRDSSGEKDYETRREWGVSAGELTGGERRERERGEKEDWRRWKRKDLSEVVRPFSVANADVGCPRSSIGAEDGVRRPERSRLEKKRGISPPCGAAKGSTDSGSCCRLTSSEWPLEEE